VATVGPPTACCTLSLHDALPIFIAGGAIGLAAYFRARNTEVAIESIAVLPFANQSNDTNVEYLSDGLTESIINSLTQLPNLKVRSEEHTSELQSRVELVCLLLLE